MRDETRATLTILSSSLTADELTARVSLVPDEAWAKGHVRGADRVHDFHGISYVAEGQNASPSEAVASLLRRLAPATEHIASLASDDAVRSARVRIAHHTEGDNPEVWLTAVDLRALSAMRVDVVVDSYFYGDGG